MGIIHSKNYSIRNKLFKKIFIKKIWKLFIQKNYSFFWKIDYRPGLSTNDLTPSTLITNQTISKNFSSISFWHFTLCFSHGRHRHLSLSKEATFSFWKELIRILPPISIHLKHWFIMLPTREWYLTLCERFLTAEEDLCRSQVCWDKAYLCRVA